MIDEDLLHMMKMLWKKLTLGAWSYVNAKNKHKFMEETGSMNKWDIDVKIRDLNTRRKNIKELDQALKERDDFKVKLEKWSNASVLQNEVLNKQRYVSDKSCIGFGIESSNSMESDISTGDETLTDSAYENFKREKAYKAVPPPTRAIQIEDLKVYASLTVDALEPGSKDIIPSGGGWVENHLFGCKGTEMKLSLWHEDSGMSTSKISTKLVKRQYWSGFTFKAFELDPLMFLAM
ncbi:hypothetical protein Tco_1056620 [Tanacetum coccineum]|uniref:Uncharacterized protein n=1 Tax=Tanacetum coccineum TaxID=301880 RepID=A0ABQ5H308_9ASTR